MNLGRYKKFLAALIAGLAVLAASIPLDADPKVIAAGQLVTALAVLLAPRNDRPVTRDDLKRKVDYWPSPPSQSRPNPPPPTRHVRGDKPDLP